MIPTRAILFNSVPLLNESVDDQIIHVVSDLFLDLWGVFLVRGYIPAIGILLDIPIGAVLVYYFVRL